MVRNLTLILPMCLAFSAASLSAAPITYDISFTNTGFIFGSGILPAAPTGSFVYDAATSQFSNFVVSWNGTAFDLTTSANGYVPRTTTLPAPACNLTGGAAGAFSLLGQALTGCTVYDWNADASPTGGYFNFLADQLMMSTTAFSAFSAGSTNGQMTVTGKFTVTERGATGGGGGTGGGGVSGVPEPATWLLSAGALVAVAARSRLRERRSAL